MIFSGCASSPEVAQPELSFFSLQNFFKAEINRLNAEKPEVEKRIELNGQSESLKTSDIDWNKELSFFLESDINKPAWLHSYEVDTVTKNNQREISYKALEDKLLVRTLTLLFSDKAKNPHTIKIKRSTKNLFYTSDMDLMYSTQQYEISSKSQTLLGSQKDLNVSCSWD